MQFINCISFILCSSFLQVVDIVDFISFLRRPSFGIKYELKSYYSYFKFVWNSFLVLTLFSILSGLLISAPLKYLKLFPGQLELDFSWVMIFKITLLLPVVEELIFRLPLKFSKINFSVSAALIFFLIFYRLNLIAAFSLSLFLPASLFLWNRAGSYFPFTSDMSSARIFLLLFYSQAVVFGLLHLGNYKLDYNYWYLFPFFVINQIFMGCFFGYVRVKYRYGILLCIICHIVINSLYCLVLFR
jgi:hypothetical protein